MTYLVGLDLGTSAVKALMLSEESGRITESFSQPLSLMVPRAGWSEQNPLEWWDATCSAVRGLLHKSGVGANEISGVGISGQMHGATLLDNRGAVLRPCILWNDQRSRAECDWITERVGLEALLRWVGNPALAGFTLPKLLWVRGHEPEIYRRVARVLLPKDYLNFRLTGNQFTDYSDASGTLLFDVAAHRWSESLAGALDIPVDLFPAAVESTAVVGEVTAAAAQATGLRRGTQVVTGGADNACAAVGMGVVRPGQVLCSLGTSGTLLAPMDAPRVDPAGRLHTFCHAVRDTWYAMGVVLSAGGSLSWWHDVLIETGTEDEDTFGALLHGAAGVPAGSEGLLFLPYLSGERTPHGDPDARGVFFGLSLRHGRDHLTRSVIEGVSFALADSARLMRDLGVDMDAVRATGGGARSELWRRILASLFKARVLTAFTDAGPSFGAAILAGVGTGCWASIEDATGTLVQISEETAPDPTLEAEYAGYYRLFDGLYPDLQEAYRRLAALGG